MPNSFTETAHAGEFILSEASGSRSRENGTLKLGENLAGGTLLQVDGATLVEFTGDTNTAGALLVQAAGVLLADCDATDAATPVAYIARDAEVNLKLLTYPTDTGDEARAIASLKAIGIITRN
jgi:hypothetical protein